jgi:arsenate reductase
MRRTWHLGTCDTCKRILQQLPQSLDRQEIRTEPITGQQLDDMVAIAGSHEALFSRRARKFRELGLHQQALQEADYRALILEHDTFLKRPVTILEDRIFIGSAKKTVTSLLECLGE